jgi:hypothetical protein
MMLKIVIFNEVREVDLMVQSDASKIEEALKFAIDAIDRGDMEHGSAALEWVLERDPSNRIALIWMACTVSDEHVKRRCYSLINS